METFRNYGSVPWSINNGVGSDMFGRAYGLDGNVTADHCL